MANEMKQYEIINMSDACTVEAEDPLVASVAIIMLSEGTYGLHDEGGETVLNILAFGGETAFEGWMAGVGITDINEYIESNLDAICKVLESTLYGSFTDRETYSKALSLIDGEAERTQWRDYWESSKRSSMTMICKTAWAYAKALRERPKKAEGAS